MRAFFLPFLSFAFCSCSLNGSGEQKEKEGSGPFRRFAQFNIGYNGRNISPNEARDIVKFQPKDIEKLDFSRCSQENIAGILRNLPPESQELLRARLGPAERTTSKKGRAGETVAVPKRMATGGVTVDPFWSGKSLPHSTLTPMIAVGDPYQSLPRYFMEDDPVSDGTKQPQTPMRKGFLKRYDVSDGEADWSSDDEKPQKAHKKDEEKDLTILERPRKPWICDANGQHGLMSKPKFFNTGARSSSSGSDSYNEDSEDDIMAQKMPRRRKIHLAQRDAILDSSEGKADGLKFTPPPVSRRDLNRHRDAQYTIPDDIPANLIYHPPTESRFDRSQRLRKASTDSDVLKPKTSERPREIPGFTRMGSGYISPPVTLRPRGCSTEAAKDHLIHGIPRAVRLMESEGNPFSFLYSAVQVLVHIPGLQSIVVNSQASDVLEEFRPIYGVLKRAFENHAKLDDSILPFPSLLLSRADAKLLSVAIGRKTGVEGVLEIFIDALPSPAKVSNAMFTSSVLYAEMDNKPMGFIYESKIRPEKIVSYYAEGQSYKNLYEFINNGAVHASELKILPKVNQKHQELVEMGAYAANDMAKILKFNKVLGASEVLVIHPTWNEFDSIFPPFPAPGSKLLRYSESITVNGLKYQLQGALIRSTSEKTGEDIFGTLTLWKDCWLEYCDDNVKPIFDDHAMALTRKAILLFYTSEADVDGAKLAFPSETGIRQMVQLAIPGSESFGQRFTVDDFIKVFVAMGYSVPSIKQAMHHHSGSNGANFMETIKAYEADRAKSTRAALLERFPGKEAHIDRLMIKHLNDYRLCLEDLNCPTSSSSSSV